MLRLLDADAVVAGDVEHGVRTAHALGEDRRVGNVARDRASAGVGELHGRGVRARKRDDLVAARELNTRIRATSTLFYADPRTDMHNRMKEALVLMGKLDCAAVRPPLMKLSADEIGRIRQGLVAAGLLAADGRALRAA